MNEKASRSKQTKHPIDRSDDRSHGASASPPSYGVDWLDRANAASRSPEDRVLHLRSQWCAVREEIEEHREQIAVIQSQLDKELATRANQLQQLRASLDNLEEEGTEAVWACVFGFLSTILAVAGPVAGFAANSGKLSAEGEKLFSGFATLGGFGAIVGEITTDAAVASDEVSMNEEELAIVAGTILGVPIAEIASAKVSPRAGVLISVGLALINIEEQAFQFYHELDKFEDTREHSEFIGAQISSAIEEWTRREELVTLLLDDMLRLEHEIELAEDALVK